MSSPPNSRFAANPRPSERGSAILAVLLFASILAVLAAYFLTHANTEARLATRSFYQSTAMNLAEAGIDLAMLDINNANVGVATGYSAAPDNAASWVKRVNGTGQAAYQFGQGTGNIYIRIDGWTANTLSVVTVTVAGLVTFPNPQQAPIAKQIYVQVVKRATQAAAILSKGAINFNGNVSIDAYSSLTGVPNASTNRTDKAVVASNSTTVSPNIGNATVYGYLETGGAAPIIGSSGSVTGASTPNGVKVDPSRVLTNFNQNIPVATAPSGTAISLGALTSATLPQSGDVPQANGRYLYTASSVSLSGHNTVTINGPVDLIITGDMSMGGTAGITVGSSASLNVYGYGNLQIGGNGVTNATNVPSNTSFYGLGAAGSTVSVGGNGTFTGVVNAPNADITVAGNATIAGAVVGNSVTFSGNATLHYDTQLSGTAASPYYYVKTWVELTDASTGTSPFKRDARAPFTNLFL
jgi:Tfp pilus assembly protein PilX